MPWHPLKQNIKDYNVPRRQDRSPDVPSRPTAGRMAETSAPDPPISPTAGSPPSLGNGKDSPSVQASAGFHLVDGCELRLVNFPGLVSPEESSRIPPGEGVSDTNDWYLSRVPDISLKNDVRPRFFFLLFEEFSFYNSLENFSPIGVFLRKVRGVKIGPPNPNRGTHIPIQIGLMQNFHVFSNILQKN